MVNRRERGEGSLTFDAHADRWIGRLEAGRGTDGRRVRVKVTGRTRAEARKKLDKLRREHELGVDVAARAITFETLASLWLDRGLAAETSQSTRENYESMLRMHLLPQLGHLRVPDLRPEHLEGLLAQMAAAGYSGRTMRLVTNLCRRILIMAERRGLVVRNIAAVVQVPRGPRAERHGLTAAQARSSADRGCRGPTRQPRHDFSASGVAPGRSRWAHLGLRRAGRASARHPCGEEPEADSGRDGAHRPEDPDEPTHSGVARRRCRCPA